MFRNKKGTMKRAFNFCFILIISFFIFGWQSKTTNHTEAKSSYIYYTDFETKVKNSTNIYFGKCKDIRYGTIYKDGNEFVAYDFEIIESIYDYYNLETNNITVLVGKGTADYIQKIGYNPYYSS